jgi:DNA polymerase-3 subunit chi
MASQPVPRADFYLITTARFREEPLRLVCELARKAYDANLSTLVLARDAEQAEQIDDLLWAFDEDAYIPHQIAGDDEDDLAPVLIASPDIDTPMRALVINLRDAAVAGSFDRVLEVVPADDSARGPLRERWKQYQARGFELKKHDM